MRTRKLVQSETLTAAGLRLVFRCLHLGALVGSRAVAAISVDSSCVGRRDSAV